MSDRDELAAIAAREWGLPAPVLVRAGMSTLFAAGDDVMLRVNVPAVSPALEFAWMSMMSRLGVRVPAMRREVIERDGLAVVGIERIHPVGEVDWQEVGAMVRRVHTIAPADAGPLPWCGDFPHWQVEALLDEVRDHVDDEALIGISACLNRWSGWHERLHEDTVVCHGDVHPGNVLPTADGPVLLDWDLRCLGPAGWDHGPLLQWGERWSQAWGGGPHAYDLFAEGYGRSLRGEWMTEALAGMRMVIATLMRVRASLTDPAAALEAEQRLRWWRGDPDAPLWEPQ
jgi:aminoglycoside phosphotransferase (APT) family kinase protein